MRFLRENSLSLVFAALTLVTLGGQSIAGHRKVLEQAREHHGAAVSYGRFVLSSDFGAAVLENWQSEFLQFSLFILATIWLIQRGSNESKAPGESGRESLQKQRLLGYTPPNGPRWARVGGWRTGIYQNSLLIAMTAIFFGTWFGQSVTGWTQYNDELRDHSEHAVSWTTYLLRADFWERSFQNWQSEFLAVGTMVIFTVYLRQRGSTESKPVGAPHDETGTSG